MGAHGGAAGSGDRPALIPCDPGAMPLAPSDGEGLALLPAPPRPDRGGMGPEFWLTTPIAALTPGTGVLFTLRELHHQVQPRGGPVDTPLRQVHGKRAHRGVAASPRARPQPPQPCIEGAVLHQPRQGELRQHGGAVVRGHGLGQPGDVGDVGGVLRLQRRDGAPVVAVLGVVVVLHDQRVVGCGPGQQAGATLGGEDRAGGELVGGGDQHLPQPGDLEGVDLQAVLVDRERHGLLGPVVQHLPLGEAPVGLGHGAARHPQVGCEVTGGGQPGAGRERAVVVRGAEPPVSQSVRSRAGAAAGSRRRKSAPVPWRCSVIPISRRPCPVLLSTERSPSDSAPADRSSMSLRLHPVDRLRACGLRRGRRAPRCARAGARCRRT